MNLARDALRLAVMEALQPGGPDAGPFPTLAGAHVYDSDFGPAESVVLESRCPIIAVYTDDDDQDGEPDALDPANAHRSVMLAFETMVPSSFAEGAFVIGPTDHEIELTLGALGSQIETALLRARESGPLRHVLVSVSNVVTRGWRDADSETRLAEKRIEMTCRIRCSDVMPGFGEGLDRLPSPLREVAKEIEKHSPRGVMLARLADLLSAPDPHQALVDLSIAMKQRDAAGVALTPETSAQNANPVAAGATLHGRIDLTV